MANFPHYTRFDAMNCGPTSLRIIAQYCKHYSLQSLREKCHISREGVSLLGISDATEAIGFRSTGIKLSWEQLRDKANLPCIVHWNQQHFVVVYRISSRICPFFRKEPSSFGWLFLFALRPFSCSVKAVGSKYNRQNHLSPTHREARSNGSVVIPASRHPNKKAELFN